MVGIVNTTYEIGVVTFFIKRWGRHWFNRTGMPKSHRQDRQHTYIIMYVNNDDDNDNHHHNDNNNNDDTTAT